MSATGEELIRLIAVMDQLRSPGGCPWDAEQTHESLVQYLIEETFEAVDAIDSGDRDHLLEELGDLLLQVYFHARIAQERVSDPFTIDDVARGIADKLIRRHPHVFPDAQGHVTPAADAAYVEAKWQELKNAEKARTSVTDGVPVSLPALTQASKLLQRLDNADAAAPLSLPAVEAVADLMTSGLDAGELMIALVARLRAEGRDPDALMRESVRAFRTAIVAAEQASSAQ
mgnify:CR=1 FL=1